MTEVWLSPISSVLVTGGTGFVGRHLCRALADHAWRVVSVGRRASKFASVPGISHVSLSLLSASEKWQEALASVDCVVHLAGLVHQSGPASKLDAAFREVNVEGSRFIAEAASRARVRRFIYVSTVKVNGEGGTDAPYTVADSPDPRDAYARSKLEAENVLREICLRDEMELVVIRPPLIYGPGVGANFQRLLSLVNLGVPLPFRAIKNHRSLIGIWNLAHFIELCMRHPSAAGSTFLISDGEDLSTPELLTKLALSMKMRARLFSVSPVLLRHIGTIAGFGQEIARLCGSLRVDSTYAHDQLQWRPILSVDEGLALTAAAYQLSRIK